MNVKVIDEELQNAQVTIDERPNSCPLCHHAIEPQTPLAGSLHRKQKWVEIAFRCPRLACLSMFIALYDGFPLHSGLLTYSLKKTTPFKPVPRSFSPIINDTSTEFCDIYNQSLASESHGHVKICGVGYRKALEFLLKDYLISLHTDKAEEIKRTFLGKCIDQYVSNENIKTVAKRAVWLGNDETHYVRVWESKDVQDLKKLVDLTVRWIEMEKLTEGLKNDMPDKP